MNIQKIPNKISYPTYMQSNDSYVKVSVMQTNEIMRTYWKSYFLAAKFLPHKKKVAVYDLYKLVRIADLIVDTPHIKPLTAQKQLQELYSHRLACYEESLYKDPIFGSTIKTYKSFNIPTIYIDDFFRVMRQDTEKLTYESYEELCAYMYWSAEVIWCMLCYIVWFSDPQTLEFAKKLGRAMQLSNFLRDIAEDYIELWRIYMPNNSLSQYNLSHSDIISFAKNKIIDDNFKQFMQSEIKRCDALYEESFQWLKLLSRYWRQALYLAGRLYQWILRKIERVDYNIFAHSARTTSSEKFVIIARYLLDRSWNK